MKKIICPTLFLHGDRDLEVPFQQSEKAFRLVKGPKEIRIIKGGGHGFRSEQDIAIDLTLKFLEKHF